MPDDIYESYQNLVKLILGLLNYTSAEINVDGRLYEYFYYVIVVESFK